jgi:hypothetical protein
LDTPRAPLPWEPSARVRPRVEEIAWGVAHQVQGQHDHEDGEAEQEDNPRAQDDELPAVASMLPQSAMGGWVPRPRKDSPAVVRNLVPTDREHDVAHEARVE